MNKLMLLLFVQIFMSFSVSFADSGEWKNKDWLVEKRGDRFFYFTHGTKVWGHEFGFIKTPGDCGNDMLWMSLSSDHDEVLNFVGKAADFRIEVGENSFDINVDMLTANKLTPVTKIMMFANFWVGDKFIDLLKKEGKLSLRIIGPKDFIKYWDIPEDNFSLDGYIAARSKAKEFCTEIKEEDKK